MSVKNPENFSHPIYAADVARYAKVATMIAAGDTIGVAQPADHVEASWLYYGYNIEFQKPDPLFNDTTVFGAQYIAAKAKQDAGLRIAFTGWGAGLRPDPESSVRVSVHKADKNIDKMLELPTDASGHTLFDPFKQFLVAITENLLDVDADNKKYSSLDLIRRSGSHGETRRGLFAALYDDFEDNNYERADSAVNHLYEAGFLSSFLIPGVRATLAGKEILADPENYFNLYFEEALNLELTEYERLRANGVSPLNPEQLYGLANRSINFVKKNNSLVVDYLDIRSPKQSDPKIFDS